MEEFPKNNEVTNNNSEADVLAEMPSYEEHMASHNETEANEENLQGLLDEIENLEPRDRKFMTAILGFTSMKIGYFAPENYNGEELSGIVLPVAMEYLKNRDKYTEETAKEGISSLRFARYGNMTIGSFVHEKHVDWFLYRNQMAKKLYHLKEADINKNVPTFTRETLTAVESGLAVEENIEKEAQNHHFIEGFFEANPDLIMYTEWEDMFVGVDAGSDDDSVYHERLFRKFERKFKDKKCSDIGRDISNGEHSEAERAILELMVKGRVVELQEDFRNGRVNTEDFKEYIRAVDIFYEDGIGFGAQSSRQMDSVYYNLVNFDDRSSGKKLKKAERILRQRQEAARVYEYYQRAFTTYSEALQRGQEILNARKTENKTTNQE